MSQPIYKLAQFKMTEAWYKLTKEEQDQLTQKSKDSLKNVGGEVLVSCAQVWASENFMAFQLEKYPSMESVLAHAMNLYQLNWWRYIEGSTTLGVDMPVL